MKSFIKWVGGKAKIFPYIDKLKPENFNKYIEPFVGSGYVFLNLENTNKIIISDLNDELINVYLCIKDDYLRLIDEIEILNKDSDYFRIRNMDRDVNFKLFDKFIRAARFIYLNKNCFNGLYRVNSKGFFNTSKGRYKNITLYKKENLKEISEFLNNKYVEIYNKSFDELGGFVESGDFVYLDPPYDPIDKTQAFTCYNAFGFKDSEQIKLKEFCDLIDKKNAYFMVSNNETKLIKELYEKYNFYRVPSVRMISGLNKGRRIISELLITNY